MKEKHYLHEATNGEIDKLIKKKATVSQFTEMFRQPGWCQFPDNGALLVCPSLKGIVLGKNPIKISTGHCEGCFYFYEKKDDL